jgi:hypothetical protein
MSKIILTLKNDWGEVSEIDLRHEYNFSLFLINDQKIIVKKSLQNELSYLLNNELAELNSLLIFDHICNDLVFGKRFSKYFYERLFPNKMKRRKI